MTPSLPVPLVTVSGTPAECGAAYGLEAADQIAMNLDVYRRRFAVQAGLDAAAVRRAGAAFREVTGVHHARVAELLDGVADGAGVAPDEIYALNARTELLYGHPRIPNEGCTSIGVLGTHTANGHLLLGQNWDWHPDQRDAMVLLHTTDEDGFAVLTLTEAGMLAKTGFNSAGVGVCVNMLGCDRDGPGTGRPMGVPYHVMLRAALESDSLTRALRSTVRPPRNASINLLLGQAGGTPTAGEVIDVELVPGDAGWLNPVDGYLTHANHFDTALQIYDTIKDWGGSSLFRAARARRLLAEAAADRKVTEDDLAAVFRDHTGFPGSICRHVDERDEPVDRSESVYSVLLDLDARRLGLAAGPPCEHEYAWTTLPR
ncbi:MAG TPA: C45 family peptidase [Micromonosporaceae bacterium]|jgi:isopenicillin-N N-acyltransferase-like protein|nr:C45 family peptidase [Micromonosporaceae bacterium]